MRKATVTSPALLDAGSDARFRQMVHDTLAFAARIQEVRSRLGSAIGLPASGYTTLITIAHLQNEKGVSVSTVAEHLHLTGAAVTIEVNRLVRLGLVSKQIDPSDRRRVRLRVTASARRQLNQLTAIQAPANDALFGCLDARRFAQFAGIIHELVSCADRALVLLPTARRASE